MRKQAVLFIFILALAAFMMPVWASADSIKATGTISRIDLASSSLVVNTNDGFVTVKMDAATKITNNGMAAPAAELQVGDRVSFRYDAEFMTAQKLNILPGPLMMRIEGFVQSVYNTPTNEVRVVIVNQNMRRVVLGVGDIADVEREGLVITPAEVKPGEHILAFYDGTHMKASNVWLWGNDCKMLEGWVLEVRYASKLQKFPTVTIGTNTGSAMVKLVVLGGATFERDHNNKSTFMEVSVKDTARVFYKALSNEMVHLETYTNKYTTK